MAVCFRGAHFPTDIVPTCVRWPVAYPLSTRHGEERMHERGVPETITIDGSEANAAAIRSSNAGHGTAIVIRQVKYVNNILEQDHRTVKRLTRPMLGFKKSSTCEKLRQIPTRPANSRHSSDLAGALSVERGAPGCSGWRACEE